MQLSLILVLLKIDSSHFLQMMGACYLLQNVIGLTHLLQTALHFKTYTCFLKCFQTHQIWTHTHFFPQIICIKRALHCQIFKNLKLQHRERKIFQQYTINQSNDDEENWNDEEHSDESIENHRKKKRLHLEIDDENEQPLIHPNTRGASNLLSTRRKPLL